MKLPLAPGGSLFGGHTLLVTRWVSQLLLVFHSKYVIIGGFSARHTPTLHQKYVKKLGRNVRLRGVFPVRTRYPDLCSSENDLSFLQWEQHRLLTLDPVTVAHVLKNSTVYEKPYISRRLIEWIIGCGMLTTEGDVHKRQRRVATPAFSMQNVRAIVPLVFNKGEELKDTWMKLIQERATKDSQKNPKGLRLDVCHWLTRATFDVIGLAGAFLPSPHQTTASPCLCSGFDYHFNVIQNEDDELFKAHRDMFEYAISQPGLLKTTIYTYVPILNRLFVRLVLWPAVRYSVVAESPLTGRGDKCCA